MRVGVSVVDSVEDSSHALKGLVGIFIRAIDPQALETRISNDHTSNPTIFLRNSNRNRFSINYKVGRRSRGNSGYPSVENIRRPTELKGGRVSENARGRYGCIRNK